MKLIRFAMLYFEKSEISLFAKQWALSLNDVVIKPLTIGESPEISSNKSRILVFATINIKELPKKNPDSNFTDDYFIGCISLVVRI